VIWGFGKLDLQQGVKFLILEVLGSLSSASISFQ